MIVEIEVGYVDDVVQRKEKEREVGEEGRCGEVGYFTDVRGTERHGLLT